MHCGAGVADVSIGWYYSNGSRIGTPRRDFREGHFQNGTAVLDIGQERRLLLCDAGVYMCIANSSTGGAHVRNFTLIISSEYAPTFLAWLCRNSKSSHDCILACIKYHYNYLITLFPSSIIPTNVFSLCS